MTDLNTLYADASTCECGALIEEIDSGEGYRYWAHVKRMRIPYDHAAVPLQDRGRQGAVWADISRLLASSVTAGMPDAVDESALWRDLAELAAGDRSLPPWAQVAASLLGDRYAADARLTG